MLLFAACSPSQATRSSELEAFWSSSASGEATAKQRSRDAGASREAPATGIWVELSRSPQPVASRHSALEPCAVEDAGLSRVAAWVAGERARLGRAPELGDVAFRLRAAGAPYVWPRVWVLEGTALGDELVRARLAAWLARAEPAGERRCGLGRARTGSGKEVVAALAVDAVADLEPVPVRVHAGRWLTLQAHMLVPAEEARVVLLGPDPVPRSVPATLSDGRIRAVFSLDRPGPWRIQVLATTAGGPRPALELWAFADSEPFAQNPTQPLPGEGAALSAVNDTRMLLELINAARGLEQRGALARDAALDVVAQRHAEAMLAADAAGHDVGGGSPAERVAAAGLSVFRVGENVAHAATVLRAQRALWESPAHRDTLLDARFDALGLGIASGPDGSVWLCELFADYGEAGNPNE